MTRYENGTRDPNCRQVEELLPDYLQGALAREADDRVEEHLRNCADCRESVALWNKLSLLPQEQPTPVLRERFRALLQAFEEGRAVEGMSHDWKRRQGSSNVVLLGTASNWLRWAAVAAGVVMLLGGGFAAGRLTGKTVSLNDPQVELASMRTELAGMRQLVVLSMLQQQSAAERLQAITLSTQQGHSDPKVLEALLGALRSDGNVAVRLAALDALSHHGRQPIVQRGLVNALQPQESPLVQVALIDLLVEMREPGARLQLQRVRQDPNLNPVVRQRAEWALAKLN